MLGTIRALFPSCQEARRCTHRSRTIPPSPAWPASRPRLPASHALQTLPVQFNGDARDYFRVWLVNALLTIITFGIWSAWAKVRTQRWFYGHTQIGGHGFEYHATGGRS